MRLGEIWKAKGMPIAVTSSRAMNLPTLGDTTLAGTAWVTSGRLLAVGSI